MPITIYKKRPKDIKLLNLSVSKSKTFKQCKKKFRFDYIERLPKKTWDYHIFGKFLHKVLEDFHLDRLNGGKEPDNILMAKCFKSAKKEYADKITKDQLEECYSICSDYLKQVHELTSINMFPKILAVEEEFYININDKVLLNGFIDRVQMDHDNILNVADYKTSDLNDKKNPHLKFHETDKYKRFKRDLFQLQTYAFVKFLQYPEMEVIRGSFIMLRHKFHLIEKEFHRDKVMQLEDVYLDYAEKIESEKLFRATVSPLCDWCDFLSSCEEGQRFLQKEDVSKFGETNW